jgi:hypothetical protein
MAFPSFHAGPGPLADCQFHGAGAELFVVEGESAAAAVCGGRDPTRQAVLPMQGKPLNALKATEKKVAANPLFAALAAALGSGWGEALDLQKLRYTKVLLLMDPDADGIHCGLLLLSFFPLDAATLGRGPSVAGSAPLGGSDDARRTASLASFGAGIPAARGRREWAEASSDQALPWLGGDRCRGAQGHLP